MAKGYNNRGMRGMGGMGGGMNMNMLRQAQKMQADMQKMQGQLEEKSIPLRPVAARSRWWPTASTS